MTVTDSIQKTIVDYLYNYKAYDLPEVCKSYGIECNEQLNPNSSKRLYISSGLKKMNLAQTKDLVKKIITNGADAAFVRKIEPFMDDDFFSIPMVSRRAILDWLSTERNLEGKKNIVDLLSMSWNLKSIAITNEWCDTNAYEYLLQHMVRNDDITYVELFEEILDIIYVPDSVLVHFLESLVDSSIREDSEMAYYIGAINKLLATDGYRFQVEKRIAGRPIYKIVHGSGGIEKTTKNIIFGAYDGKPDIVISDALTNDIEIVGDSSKCLLYMLPPNSNGLSWHELVTWWNGGNEEYDIEVEKALVSRLILSLDSEPEKIFLRTYYNFIYKQRNNNLPALIPQVYCLYDPQSARMRGGQSYVFHQRMDFLILMPNWVRVVIEIDGKQHYSVDNIASPELYAKMVEDDRKLSLYGYDVYRFGGQEFVNGEEVRKKIEAFITDLFKKYDIIPAK